MKQNSVERLLNAQNRKAALNYFRSIAANPPRTIPQKAALVAIAAIENVGAPRVGCSGCMHQPEYPVSIHCNGCARRYKDRFTAVAQTAEGLKK